MSLIKLISFVHCTLRTIASVVRGIGGCSKLDYLGDSPCTATKSECALLNFISSSVSARRQPSVSWVSSLLAGLHRAQFIDEIDAYIRWYNETCIKMSLGGRSPIKYRKSLGLMP